MERFLADENLNARIVRGIQREIPDLDILSVQDVGLRAVGDPDILEWAASHGRVVITHDVATMTRFVNDRLRSNLPMPGLVEISTEISVGEAVKDLYLLIMASLPGELEGRIRYIPL